MTPVALLVTHAYWPGPDPQGRHETVGRQIDQLTQACAVRGVALTPAFWEDEGQDWARFAAVCPLMAWNYPRAPERFAACLAEVEGAGVRLLNGAGVIGRNLDKAYLGALASAGAPSVPTLYAEPTEAAIRAAFDALGADEIVVKPRVGAGAWRQARLKRSAPLPPADDLRPGEALIQPFLPAIETEGEASLLFFGGRFSHALMKTPKPGDYRTQGHHGAREHAWTAPADALATAEKALAAWANTPAPPPAGELSAQPTVGGSAALPPPALRATSPASGGGHSALLYARVDLVRHESRWLVMELELIEPYLYLDFAPDPEAAAGLFAGALADALA
jgi:hypothetical protein